MDISPQIVADRLIDTLTGPVGLAFSLTLLGALTIGSLKQRKAKLREVESNPLVGPNVPREEKIPVVQHDPDQVDRAAVMNRVSHLAVSQDWATLAEEIADWERRLEAAPGGERYHDIGIETCLTGLRSLLDKAPRQTLADLEIAEKEVARFMERHRADPSDHILAVLAARAHIMMAETCNADFWPPAAQKQAWRQMAHHYLQAETVLSGFDPVEYMSPLLASSFYDLALGMPDGGSRIEPAFEDWIDLDPSDPAIYAHHIPILMRQNEGKADLILAEAERARDRTEGTLGHGGYALCVLPAIAEDADFRAQVDISSLAGGLMDLARSSATQAEVNWATAVLANEAEFAKDGDKRVLLSAFDSLIQRDLSVIYPRIWDREVDSIRDLLRETFGRNGTPRLSSATLYAPPETKAAVA